MKQKAIEGNVGWTLSQALHRQALSGEGRNQDLLTRWGAAPALTGEVKGLMIIWAGFVRQSVERGEKRHHCPPWASRLMPPSCLTDAPKGVEILLSPSGRNILPGDLVILTCQVNSSYPEVSFVQWTKDGTQLQVQGRMLKLSQATLGDAGIYTCQAGNAVGSSVSPPISLHIFSESCMSLGLDQRVGRGPGHCC